MTITEVKDYLTKLTGHIVFDYNGCSCGIDPLSRNRFTLWCGDDEMTAGSVDEVLNVKFFGGKSLTEIWDNITEPDY